MAESGAVTKPEIYQARTRFGITYWTFKCHCGYASLYWAKKSAEIGLTSHWAQKHREVGK